VLVIHDLLNLTFGPPAKFVRRYGDARELISDAIQAFREDVAGRHYPADEESYHLPKETRAALDTVLERKWAMRR
jgi:3-methyl-2-oxobutanoate hydroxymethyltransferase